MEARAKQLKWCILGGDERDVHFARSLLSKGYDVTACGFPRVEELPREVAVDDPCSAVKRVEILVCPVTGTDGHGILRKSTFPINLLEVLEKADSTKALVIGTAIESVQRAASERGIVVIESMRDDELAILNSIPSAEGALQLAMEHSDFTIHGSRSAVLGLGRTGLTLASLLLAVRSSVTVFARKPQDLARARALGFAPVKFDDLCDALPQQDLVFNTVPAVVLTRALLEAMPRNAVVIDLASPPGGVDYQAAREIGVKAILAPGLPGLVAPRTAGEILASVVPRLVDEAL
jgi:dipicolinate synthase subunit A